MVRASGIHTSVVGIEQTALWEEGAGQQTTILKGLGLQHIHDLTIYATSQCDGQVVHPLLKRPGLHVALSQEDELQPSSQVEGLHPHASQNEGAELQDKPFQPGPESLWEE